jgi:chitin disaccharide deacetylase
MRKTFLALLLIALLAVAAAIDRALPARPERYVVITSDDAGMCRPVNAATIDAMDYGLVSSCSIRVDGPAFEEFARYAAAHPEKDYGVHLSLNCERDAGRWGPVLDKARVPSLVDHQGHLWRHTWEAAEHAKIDEVEDELRAQIDRCRNAGVRLTHLDHNMFVLYSRPDFLRLYVRLGLDYNLPIRYSIALPSPGDLNPGNAELLKAYREGLETLRSRNMPVFRAVDTLNYQVPPAEKRRYYFDLFPKIQPGVSEILMHCAYDKPGFDRAPAADRRDADTRVFMSQETAEVLARQGIRVITWRTFREMHDKKDFAGQR